MGLSAKPSFCRSLQTSVPISVFQIESTPIYNSVVINSDSVKAFVSILYKGTLLSQHGQTSLTCLRETGRVVMTQIDSGSSPETSGGVVGGGDTSSWPGTPGQG